VRSLTVDILHHQRTGNGRCKKPQRYDRSEADGGGRRSDCFFSFRLCDEGELATFTEHLWGYEFLEQLYTQEENQKVVQKTNQWNKARN